jgi:N-sulfoglucosamine sulfohydrolase
MTHHPNVLVYISHDTGQHISPYGISTVHTPNAERVASEGALFSRYFCAAPQCSPSRAATFTGRHPHAVGVLGLTDAAFGWTLNVDEIHMAQHLRQLGYETALFGLAHEAAGGGCDESLLDPVGYHFRKHQLAYPARQAPEDLAAWLAARDHPDRPFFAQIGVFETHRWRDGRYRDFDGVEPDDSLGVTVPPYLNDTPGTREDFAELQGSVRRWDKGLGDILALLDEQELTDDTLLIVTTDHGIAMPRAKCSLYDPGLEILLMLRWPGVIEEGVHYDDLISNVDLLPTVLQALGADIPGRLHGHSFWPLLAGLPFEPREMIFGERTFHIQYCPARCVRTSTHKYIRRFEAVVPENWPGEIDGLPIRQDNLDRFSQNPRGPLEELYDLAVDPLEQVNVVDDAAYSEVRSTLSSALASWMVSTEDPLLDGPIASPGFRRRMSEMRKAFDCQEE